MKAARPAEAGPPAHSMPDTGISVRSGSSIDPPTPLIELHGPTATGSRWHRLEGEFRQDPIRHLDDGTRISDLRCDPELAACRAIVAIPARDEARRMKRCLDSVIKAIGMGRVACGIVVLANNSSDGTAPLAAGCLAMSDVPHRILDVRFPAAIADAGHARGLALDFAADCPRAEVLLSTDADSSVGADWLDRALRQVPGRADLLCGALDVDRSLIDAMPPLVRACGEAEAALMERLEAIWTAYLPPRAGPFHHPCSGANFAIARDVYEALGGLDRRASGEDRRLAEMVARAGFRIAQDPRMRVRTSCRTTGRASGGMAEALRDRMTSSDPFCDEALVPLSALWRRMRWWRTLAMRHPPRSGPAQTAPGRALAEAWSNVLALEPELASPRMRLSDVYREIALIDRLGIGQATPDHRAAV